MDIGRRSVSTEKMDDFQMEGPDLREALDTLAKINRYLGGNRITLDGIKSLLSQASLADEISIVDMGCGNGDMLRTVADFGEKNNLKLRLVGIDANQYAVNYARELSKRYPNIEYQTMDIKSKGFQAIKADIFTCTLTLHHFTDEAILSMLSILKQHARLGLVVNDLQRSAWAYRLFQLLCFVLKLNAVSREDGLISILRGFKRKELVAFSRSLDVRFHLHWKWAFRYQWIISTLCVSK